LWRELSQGSDGIAQIERFDTSGFGVKIAVAECQRVYPNEGIGFMGAAASASSVAAAVLELRQGGGETALVSCAAGRSASFAALLTTRKNLDGPFPSLLKKATL
jgi:hypothetical protein